MSLCTFPKAISCHTITLAGLYYYLYSIDNLYLIASLLVNYIGKFILAVIAKKTYSLELVSVPRGSFGILDCMFCRARCLKIPRKPVWDTS